MRRFFILQVVSIIFIVILVPAFIINNFNFKKPSGKIAEKKEEDIEITVFLHEIGKTKKMPLEKYLIGVLAQEMPIEFEIEALKAQAVAARTYTLKKLELFEETKDNSPHKDAVICTDYRHCQAWLSEEEMKKKWGKLKFVTNYKKLEEAVQATKGEVLVYEEKLVEPVYHSTCGGKTENSEEVWGNKIPYLRSVNCPYDYDSPRLKEAKVFSLEQLDNLIGTELSAMPVATFRQKAKSLFKIVEKTSTGRVKEIYIGGKNIEGTELRQKLGLRSTRFSLKVDESKVTFNTHGNGHGVGMCQYGANGLAKNNKNYQEILKHYYKGTKIIKYNKK